MYRLYDDIEFLVAGIDFERLERDLKEMCDKFKKQEDMLMMVAEQKYKELYES